MGLDAAGEFVAGLEAAAEKVAVGVHGLVVGPAGDHGAVAVEAGGEVEFFADAEGVDHLDAVVLAPVQVGAGVQGYAAGQGFADAGDQVVELAVIHAGRQGAEAVALLDVGLETVDQLGEEEGVTTAQVEGVAAVHEGVQGPGAGAVDAAAVADLEGGVIVEGVAQVDAGVELEVVVLEDFRLGLQEVAGGVGLLGAQAGVEGYLIDLAAETGVEGVNVFFVAEEVALERVFGEGGAVEGSKGSVQG